MSPTYSHPKAAVQSPPYPPTPPSSQSSPQFQAPLPHLNPYSDTDLTSYNAYPLTSSGPYEYIPSHNMTTDHLAPVPVAFPSHADQGSSYHHSTFVGDLTLVDPLPSCTSAYSYPSEYHLPIPTAMYPQPLPANLNYDAAPSPGSSSSSPSPSWVGTSTTCLAPSNLYETSSYYPSASVGNNTHNTPEYLSSSSITTTTTTATAPTTTYFPESSPSPSSLPASTTPTPTPTPTIGTKRRGPEARLQCRVPGCDKLFKREHTRSRHEASPSHRTITCSVCDMKFGRNHDRIRHEYLQHGIAQNLCQFCGKPFIVAKNLERHRCSTTTASSSSSSSSIDYYPESGIGE